jgi:CxxC-x17-CxxC domain-containing protein
MPFADKTLSCRDCGQAFTFTASEQQFYADRGFENDPTRCPDCRASRKASGAGNRGRSDSRDRLMTDVTCSSCGKATQVPFIPNGDRPVYCSDCFQTERLKSRSTSFR